MTEKTYVIKVNVDTKNDNYNELVEALYKLGATDVDLLEVYEDN